MDPSDGPLDLRRPSRISAPTWYWPFPKDVAGPAGAAGGSGAEREGCHHPDNPGPATALLDRLGGLGLVGEGNWASRRFRDFRLGQGRAVRLLFAAYPASSARTASV